MSTAREIGLLFPLDDKASAQLMMGKADGLLSRGAIAAADYVSVLYARIRSRGSTPNRSLGWSLSCAQERMGWPGPSDGSSVAVEDIAPGVVNAYVSQQRPVHRINTYPTLLADGLRG